MKCVYPSCRTSVEEENAWCADHQAVTCRYPLYEPCCQERPMPRSVYCKEHDKVASFVKLFHAALHQEAAAAQAQVRSQQAAVERAKVRLWNGHN